MGCWDEVDFRSFSTRLMRGELVSYDGTPLLEESCERLVRETSRLEIAEQHLATLERTLQERQRTPSA
jgi:transposase